MRASGEWFRGREALRPRDDEPQYCGRGREGQTWKH